jgi:(2Fe-2S) ferredoxin
MGNAPPPLTVHVCRAKSCTRRGAAELAAGLEATFARERVPARVLRHDCFDLCKRACNALVEVPGLEPRLYTQLHPRRAEGFAESLVAEIQPEVGAEDLTPAGD